MLIRDLEIVTANNRFGDKVYLGISPVRKMYEGKFKFSPVPSIHKLNVYKDSEISGL